MPNPNTNFKGSDGVDLGNKLITKEYLMTVYPQIANQLITPELWIWGWNPSGVLGNNDPGGISAKVCTPVTTSAGGANWKHVSGKYFQMAAIKTDGTLWMWGRNNDQTLGTNDTNNRSSPVTTFAGGTNWKQVACGQYHTAAIKTDGTLWTWGSNSFGNLGINNTANRLTPVTTFAGGTNWKQVSCDSLFSTTAIKTDGTLWSWGLNDFGQLGTNDIITRTTPVTTFAGGTNWKQVACGYMTIGAIKTDGTLWVWGFNEDGALGDNTTTDKLTPVTTFAGGTNWKQVAECGISRAAIKTSDDLLGI